MIEMIQLDDGNYVPRDWCSVTNPKTSNGESYVDDVEMLCFSENCGGKCNNCVIQQLMNDYVDKYNQIKLVKEKIRII